MKDDLIKLLQGRGVTKDNVCENIEFLKSLTLELESLSNSNLFFDTSMGNIMDASTYQLKGIIDKLKYVRNEY